MQYFIIPNLDRQPIILGELLAEMQDPNDPNNTVQRDLTGARFLRMVAQVQDQKVPRSAFLTSPARPNETYDGTWFGITQLDREA